MICKRILPDPELRGLIKEYLTIHLIFEPNIKVPSKAYPVNPEEGIRFLVRGSLFSDCPDLGTYEKRPIVTIFGQPNSRQNLFTTNEYLMIHTRFQPGGLFKLLRIPMTELVHQNFDAELILGQEIKEVQAQLTDCINYDDMIVLLNNYFTKKFRQIKRDSQPIDKIGQIILENPQEFNLERTAKEACLSHRQFEKRFVQQIGITPKYYARICRFYQAYELKENHPNLDWLSVAVQTGYNDYQHLVKDFKQFAGTTPTTLIKESLNNPERKLGIIGNFRGV
ncbi:MAG: AraC family transcriptional regulator [Lentimicrobium sp.]|jgi:AraC-like DNA-binding protein|nr:AraC family transcriptional regulator [Lentimicrobium sp.]